MYLLPSPSHGNIPTSYQYDGVIPLKRQHISHSAKENSYPHSQWCEQVKKMCQHKGSIICNLINIEQGDIVCVG